ncbi:hypothetical protein ABW20_dc0101146 [Dactylellina cionopaga]|nr:hypothetical protein ABW20_dc0101146 [Dactylellina cionopaga]
MASTLNQEIFLGTLPAGLQFSITQTTVYCAPGGYNVQWRNATNSNVSNMDGRCISGGQQFPQVEPNPHPGKTCIMSSSFASTLPGGQPARLGQMSWSRSNTLDLFAQGVPGWIELKFLISKIAGNRALAKGSLKVTPTKFKTLERGVVIIKVIEIPELIDTTQATYEAASDFVAAFNKGDKAAMALATSKFGRGLYDLVTAATDVRGGLKEFNQEMTLRTDAIKKIIDEVNKAEEERQKNARKLRRRRLAANRKYLAYD